jgi:hypothetical protein
MARGRTVWDDEAEDILKDCRRAQHCIQLWQQAIERHGEASREAKHAAVDLPNSLESLHWGNRRPRVLPDEWDSLSSASPDLAAALVELGGAAAAARPIADAGWRKGTKPDSWDWVERLSQAVEALAAVVEGNRNLVECKKDCMEVILRTGERMRTDDVYEALRKSNRPHGKSTMKDALAELVKEGRLTNTKGARAIGYGPPGWPPKRR